MAQYVEEFGAAVRDAMDSRGFSTRDVSKRSGGKISPTSVLMMRDGKLVGPELVAEFALAVQDDPNRFLRIARLPFRYQPLEGQGEREKVSPNHWVGNRAALSPA